MLVYTGKKEFQCEVSEKKFSRKGHLKYYILTHPNVQAHECDICKKTFSQRCSLVQNFRINLGERPYGCSKCENWFIDSSNHDRRIHIYHKELIKTQQSELKSKIPRTIVYDYLNYIDEF